VLTRLASVLAIVGACSTLLPAGARAATWALGAAAGWVGDFQAVTRSYEFYGLGEVKETLAGTGFPSIYLVRGPGAQFSFIANATYLAYGDESIRARHTPFGVGVRYTPLVGTDRRGSPYVDLSPALVWSDWDRYGHDLSTALRPGLVAGLGVQSRLYQNVSVDIGLRYFLSADAAKAGTPIPQTLEGLNQAGLQIGFSYTVH
jgi:hypothetical protein